MGSLSGLIGLGLWGWAGCAKSVMLVLMNGFTLCNPN